MARVFHPDVVLWVEQQHAQQIERLLGTRDDHHLFCVALDAACVKDVAGNFLAQRQQPLYLAVPEHGLGWLAQLAIEQTLPDWQRKGIEGWVAGQERGGTVGFPGRVGDTTEMVTAHGQH
ncbi:hypothetical protein D3C76_930090 [compost metagenome]